MCYYILKFFVNKKKINILNSYTIQTAYHKLYWFNIFCKCSLLIIFKQKVRIMGQSLSEPITSKAVNKDENDQIQVAACSMQGWRIR